MGLGDDHVAHITTHLTLASDILKKLTQKQIQPIDADKVLAVITPHISEHNEAAGKNPFNKTTLEKLKPGIAQVLKLTQMNRQNATKELQSRLQTQQKDQQATQTTMSDAQRKDFTAQADTRRADQKVQSQVERAKDANATRADVMRTKVERDAENKKLEVQLKHAAMQSADATDQLESMAGETPAPTDVEMTSAPEIPPVTPLPTEQAPQLPQGRTIV
jgi:ribosome maturation factor RimP